MTSLLHGESRRMYSWWWDSHVYPKNSKWLEENLTDIDVKIKTMIKLIEEDGDSFAMKAEMYYNRRPELMTLVEDFYRAYRALAERYDHADRVIRHAQNTMSEALPNHAPLMFTDNSPPSAGTDHRPPEMFKPEAEEILTLKAAITKLEAEKEAGVARHQECLKKLSDLQREMSKARDDFRRLLDHASIVDDERFNTEVVEAQPKIEPNGSVVEKNDAVKRYISNLEIRLQQAEEDNRGLKERAEVAETEIEILKQSILSLTEEKEAAATQYQSCLETLSSNLPCAPKEAKNLNTEIDDNEASKFTSAEERCCLLEKMNQSLHSEMEALMLKMKTQTQELTKKQKELGKVYRQLEGRRRILEKEKNSTLQRVDELSSCLESERDEHARYVQMTEVSNTRKDLEMRLLQEECEIRKRELDSALDNAIVSEIQISVLQITAQGMEEDNYALSLEYLKLIEKSRLSAKKISKLEARIIEQQEGIKYLREEVIEREINEEIMKGNLLKKITEKDEMEAKAESVYRQLNYSMINQFIYEQKVLELHEACLRCMNQNKCLRTQLDACGPEISLLKECIASLENHIGVHIKLQDPENNESQGAGVTSNSSYKDIANDGKETSVPSTFSDLCKLRVRLQATAKAAADINEQLAKENVGLRLKVDDSTRQLEAMQSERVRHQTNMKLMSDHISETDGAVLTKDILLDRVSSTSSHSFKKRENLEMNKRASELWETCALDGNIGLTFTKSKKLDSPSSPDNTDICLLRVTKTPKRRNCSTLDSKEEQSVDKSQISETSLQEGNKRKYLQRINSDVQKLENLRIIVQDLKRKLALSSTTTAKKGIIECESLERQLQEADTSVATLIDRNDRQMRSINGLSSSTNSSFDFENEIGRSRRISQEAQNMAENIGRLEEEVQQLKLAIQKLDNDNDGQTKTQETRRSVLLKEYIYGVSRRTYKRPKKIRFCACIKPSTHETLFPNCYLPLVA
ncbi:protein NETWORKED 1A-like [Andrographis paniculata]|uniref:protein NETWORKED 1A-like n=1 Tax=Andrographis paniculata TaxID=175694 RepID=UPI0021E820B2|nr:protein NETWORKED 1A-like [Andrographis paniculata]